MVGALDFVKEWHRPVTTGNRRRIPRTAALFVLAAFAAAAAMGSSAVGCGLDLQGAEVPDAGEEGELPRLDSGVEVDAGGEPDVACLSSCSADGGQILDCRGAVLGVCGAGSACGADASCVADPWTPSKLPGVALWLRADRGLSTDDAGVTPDAGVQTWVDQSGRGNHATQATAAFRPVLSSFPNGTPALDFAGARWLENSVTNVVATSRSTYTVLSVGQGSPIPFGPTFTIRRGPGYSASLFVSSGGKLYVHSDGVSAVSLQQDITSTITAPFQSVHAYPGSATAPEIFVNGVARAVDVGAVQVAEIGLTGVLVGVCVPNVAGTQNQYWNGKLAEVVVLTGPLPVADRALWDEYARARYALP
jgi:hypothetical protein